MAAVEIESGKSNKRRYVGEMGIDKYEVYTEDMKFANHYRVHQYRELLGFIEQMREKADERRKIYLQPDYSSIENYEKGMRKYRDDFIQMLGFPQYMYGDRRNIPEADVSFIAEDRYGKIYRLVIDACSGLSAYGLLYLPHGGFPCPLVIAQHGGGGTPEKIAGLNGYCAYSDMVRRVLARGAAVFSPQLMTWSGEEHGPSIDRTDIDNRLRQLGSSIVAADMFKIMRSLDYLLNRDEIDAEKVGMMGVSYGGFFSLYTAAADTRIKSVIASCSFTNRYVYCNTDKAWNDSAEKFLDAEVCALVCPRRLYIEVGMYDTVFDYKFSAKEYERAAEYYNRLGVPDRIVFHIHPYTHIFDRSDAGIDFLMNGLNS